MRKDRRKAVEAITVGESGNGKIYIGRIAGIQLLIDHHCTDTAKSEHCFRDNCILIETKRLNQPVPAVLLLDLPEIRYDFRRFLRSACLKV